MIYIYIIYSQSVANGNVLNINIIIFEILHVDFFSFFFFGEGQVSKFFDFFFVSNLIPNKKKMFLFFFKTQQLNPFFKTQQPNNQNQNHPLYIIPKNIDIFVFPKTKFQFMKKTFSQKCNIVEHVTKSN